MKKRKALGGDGIGCGLGRIGVHTPPCPDFKLTLPIRREERIVVILILCGLQKSQPYSEDRVRFFHPQRIKRVQLSPLSRVGKVS